ncbi:sensor histidine kinase [Pseudomarimonas salicorniae]|uniref:histidine kinase n=1 Tax=Pseudomarimonas salicorniae TaxID=2933270 RepID=A0ABT0GKK9_9GAMM|nr:HAMP domain-containing sensor histidine kinase [Lysobacter sp. CAU 1642]MCK7595060.1 HAMP domain-containing histidine kinase [Lysobacter sp. CAU 1642]
MTLQLRLTLAFAALLGALGLAALFGLDALTRDMQSALGDTARSVGARVFTLVREEHAALVERSPAEGGTLHEVETVVLHGPDPVDGGVAESRLEVVVNGERLSPEQIAALPDDHPARRALQRSHRPPAGAAQAPVGLASHADPVLWLQSGDGLSVPIPIPASRADRAIDDFRQRLLWGLGTLLLLGLVAAAWMARRVAAPLRELAQASERLGHGELSQRVVPNGPPEVRRSLEAFNRMADDLSRLQAEADALRADRELAELGEIGRGLAHSLRNPLHALGLSLEALAADGDRVQAAALADNGREQLARIDQALRGFLALSASAGAAIQMVELDEVIGDVVLEASQRAQGRVAIRRERTGLRLAAVAAELRIILHALVINALEASAEGGEVEIRAHEAEDGLRVEVADRGPGLPASVRERLFQPHVSSKPAGAGMGLYLTERLVRLRYRGSLVLDDREQGGTVARLQLRQRERREAGA